MSGEHPPVEYCTDDNPLWLLQEGKITVTTCPYCGIIALSENSLPFCDRPNRELWFAKNKLSARPLKCYGPKSLEVSQGVNS